MNLEDYDVHKLLSLECSEDKTVIYNIPKTIVSNNKLVDIPFFLTVETASKITKSIVEDNILVDNMRSTIRSIREHEEINLTSYSIDENLTKINAKVVAALENAPSDIARWLTRIVYNYLAKQEKERN